MMGWVDDYRVRTFARGHSRPHVIWLLLLPRAQNIMNSWSGFVYLITIINCEQKYIFI